MLASKLCIMENFKKNRCGTTHQTKTTSLVSTEHTLHSKLFTLHIFKASYASSMFQHEIITLTSIELNLRSEQTFTLGKENSMVMNSRNSSFNS
jgi:hypothetical protein